jgi:hypothetical protein
MNIKRFSFPFFTVVKLKDLQKDISLIAPPPEPPIDYEESVPSEDEIRRKLENGSIILPKSIDPTQTLDS